MRRLRSIDHRIESKQLNERKIYLWSQVDDHSARDLVEKIIYLDTMDSEEDITLYINSPGGSVTAGMAILDAMNLARSNISTVVMGMAASFAAVLLCAGTRGKRYAYPHSRVMIHQPHISGQIIAPAADIRIHAEQIRQSRDELNRIIAEATGQPLEQVEKDTDRDYFLNAVESRDYGLVDSIIERI